MEEQFPLDMFHATLPPVRVVKKEDLQKWLDKGFTRRYIEQKFPMAIHSPEGESIKVFSQEDFDSYIKKGWTLEYVAPKVAPVADKNPDTRMLKLESRVFALEGQLADLLKANEKTAKKPLDKPAV